MAKKKKRAQDFSLLAIIAIIGIVGIVVMTKQACLCTDSSTLNQPVVSIEGSDNIGGKAYYVGTTLASEERYCYEYGDNGLDKNTYGQIDSNYGYSGEDVCLSGMQLQEAYCDGNEGKIAVINCPCQVPKGFCLN